MKKIFKWTAIIIVALLVVLLVTPLLFKGKIIGLIKQQANNTLNADIDFKDVDLSLIRHFPLLSVNLEGLSIANHAPFEGDTLIKSNSIRINLDLMSVISGSEIKIRAVIVDGATMNFQVTKEGKANWDITKPSSTAGAAQPSSFKASLQHYAILHSNLIYNDQSLGFYLSMDQLNHEGKGDFTQDLFILSTHTTADKANMSYDKIPYLLGVKTVIDADLEMDMKNMKFVFKDNKVAINDLHAGVNGFVAMPDTNIDMDLKFTTAESDFKTFLSLIPALYSKDFSQLTASGSMKLDGYLKGRYNAISMPGFGAVLSIDNGRFKYPSLPSEVKDVFIDFKVDNPDGVPDHTVLNLSRFHASLSGDVIDAKLALSSPVSDPNMDVYIKGKLNLSGIKSFYPLEQGTELSGVIITDATIKGRLSAIKNQQTDKVNAGGTIDMADVRYAGTQVAQPVHVRSLKLMLTPKLFQMPVLDMSFGNTILNASGNLENLLGYILKDELLKGSLTLSSPKIDMKDWMTSSDTAAAPSAGADTLMKVIEVPLNIDFTMNCTIGVLIYDKLTISDVKGVLTIRDQAIRMNDLSMNMLEGSMKMSGTYAVMKRNAPSIDFNLAIKDFDIKKTAEQFSTVEKMAPLAKHCAGKFGVVMELKGQLDAHMQPVINTLSGLGKLNTNTVTIANVEAFNKVADALKMNSWKQINIPSMNPSFKFFNGRVYVDPFDVTINSYKAKIAGSNGFDQSIDYTLNVDLPRSAFGSAANTALDNLIATANSKGASFKVGDVIPVTILMKGTVKEPKVSTDLNRQGAKAFDDLKAAAEAEFAKQKAAAEAKLREEADRLKAEAETKLNAEKAKAQAELDRLKKEAETKAKAQADSLKKAAENEAKKVIDQFNPFKKK